jgi:imidazolonepropionase-like amidohydrolase
MVARLGIHMKSNAGRFFLLCLLSFLAVKSFGADENSLVFVHATVIDATGAPAQSDATVVIMGNRITAIGKSAAVPTPANARTVDATGKFLIPGLWDMHVHWYAKDYLPLFIANGVTGARIMWGMPEHHEWRKEIAHGSLLGPRLLIASAIIDGPNPTWPGSDTASNAVEGRAAVIKAKQEGADFVKVYSGLPRDAYFAIVDEAKKQGLPVEGHVPYSVSPEEASAAGQKSIEHLNKILPACTIQDVYNPVKAEALFAEFKANHTWQCPTLTVLHLNAADPSIVTDARVKYMPSLIRSYWTSANNRFTNQPPATVVSGKKTFQMNLGIVGAMQRAGVGILAGTDTGNPYCFPGFSLHDELAWLVQAGLTPMEAIQAATRNAARFMDRQNELGTIEQGKLADLVLLDANPLDDIANTRKIAAVVYGGRLFPKSSLDQMLAKMEALASRKTVSDMLFETFTQIGVEAAIQQYHELKSAHPDAMDFSEDDLNTLGYELLVMKRNKDAIKVLKLNVETYPQSANVYTSLAAAYVEDGDKKLAVENFEKSLRLDPKNRNAIEQLKQLQAQ